MKEIKPREGYYLTQSVDVAKKDRMFIITLKGMNINEADWREATQEEKDIHDAEMKKNYFIKKKHDK